MSEEEVWTYVDCHLSDLRQPIAEMLSSQKPLVYPQTEQIVELAYQDTSLLPAVPHHALRIARIWQLNNRAEAERTRQVPPLHETDTMLNVLLVLGVFMNVGRTEYDQLAVPDLKALTEVAQKVREYTAVIDLSDPEEASAVYKELSGLLRAGETVETDEASEPTGSPPLNGARQQDISSLFAELYRGARQVSMTCKLGRVCLGRSCGFYATGRTERMIVPPLPQWQTGSRRYPHSLGSLLTLCFEYPSIIVPSPDQRCPDCRQPTGPIWSILDGPPLRLVLASPFTPDELKRDRLQDISWSYMNPSKQFFEIAYRWFAIVFQSTRSDGIDYYRVAINLGTGSFFCYDPTKPRVRMFVNIDHILTKNHRIVLRVYEQISRI